MKNVLLKNHIMNSTSADVKALIGLDEPSLSYNYQFSRSITAQRAQYSKSYCKNNYDKKTFISFEIISFDYKGVEFNMIICPAGGKANVDNWGYQEIKEPFMLGETEVTQELFEFVMGYNTSNFKISKHPVENVCWYDCLNFCNRLSDCFGLDHCYELRNNRISITFIEGSNGFRLPKEWEWQIAAMAGTMNYYAGTNDEEELKRFAWFEDNSGKKTHPVAQKLSNEWGFYDMSGNVWEWCENSDEPNENNNLYANRVFRGGGWYDDTTSLSSIMSRGSSSPSDRIVNVGFRVARTI